MHVGVRDSATSEPRFSPVYNGGKNSPYSTGSLGELNEMVLGTGPGSEQTLHTVAQMFAEHPLGEY